MGHGVVKHQFTCAECGGTFGSKTTEADLLMEYQENFTEAARVDVEAPVRVCDDCYETLMAKIAQRFPEVLGHGIVNET
jgi:hypothetical protein